MGNRPCRPQTDGKPGKFLGTLGAEIGHRESLPEFVAFCNERGLHCSPDVDGLETPPGAFPARKATEAIKKNDPRRMVEDTSGQAT